MNKHFFYIMAVVLIFAAAITGCKKDKPTPVITITVQPAAATTVTAGSISGVLTVSATVTEGATLAYQWFKSESPTTTTTGGQRLDGATSATFAIPTDLAAATSPYYYFCEVSAKGAQSKRSNAAAVTVNAPSQPSSPTIAVSATGLDNLKVGEAVTASIVYTLSNGEYAASIAAADFAVQNLPAGLQAGAATRTNATVVTVQITQAPTAANASAQNVTLPANIPAANIAGATAAIAPTGAVTASAVAKGDGASLSNFPTVASKTDNSITVNAVTISGANPGGQTVEYAISKSQALPTSDWQSDTQFNGLDALTIYYVFARSAENANYNAGVFHQRSLGIMTASDGSVALGTITMKTAKSGNVILLITGNNITIDWGDGTIETKGDLVWWQCNHNYTIATERTIAITGENIYDLFCENIELTELDVTNIPSLYRLRCSGNQLSELDISNNAALVELLCWSNQLTELNISTNALLEMLSCGSNKISVLDVSKHTALEQLYCDGNELTSLNVSAAHTGLLQVHCTNNKLDAAALNALFNSLPTVAEGWIFVGGNPGFEVGVYNPALATSKGWEVSDFD